MNTRSNVNTLQSVFLSDKVKTSFLIDDILHDNDNCKLVPLSLDPFSVKENDEIKYKIQVDHDEASGIFISQTTSSSSGESNSSVEDNTESQRMDHISSALNALIEMANCKMDKMSNDYLQRKNFIDPELTAFYNRHDCLKKRRKARTAFNQSQICRLELQFQKQRYLSHTDRDRLARQLGITSSQVITWFQNRRAKMKREAMELQNDLLATHSSSIISLSPAEICPSPAAYDKHEITVDTTSNGS